MRVFKKNIVILVIISIYSMLSASIAAPIPLWTPEDVVASPVVGIKDVSSDGKHTIMQILETSDKGPKKDQHLRCILMNNEDLTQEIIGKSEDWCSEARFIGQEDKISYLVQNDDFTTTFFVKDMITNKITEIQRLKKGERNPVFAPDGKSYVYIEISIFKDDSPRRIAGQEIQLKLKLYHQELDDSLKPLGKPQLLTPESLIVSAPARVFQADYIWSPDNKTLLFVLSDPKWKDISSATLNLINLRDKKMEKLAEGNYVSGSFKFSPDGQSLVALRPSLDGAQRTGIIPSPEATSLALDIINIKTKKIVSCSMTDILSIIGWTADNKGLVLIKQERTKQKLGVWDSETKKISFKDNALQDLAVVSKAVLSKNQKYIAFTAENFYQPSEIYVTELEHLKPKKITSIHKKVDLTGIRAHSLQWKSFDGLEIEGILVYPQNYKEGEKFPLLVSVHGGPTAAESESFIGSIWIDQFAPAVLASLDYGVLVVNYRGSTGYGEKFQTLNYRDMGGGDFKDIMSGIDHLIAQGLVDPEKLFISGASYGGFMSAWAVGQTDRFKAAVMSAGIVDWISDIATTDYPTPMEAILGGYYWDDYDLWRKSSPLSYVHNVQTPTLILHGSEDDRVRNAQAQQFYHVLKARKIPTRFVDYTREEHGLSEKDAIKNAMNEIIQWIGEHGGCELD